MPIFIVSLIIAVIALLMQLAVIDGYGIGAGWAALIAYVVLGLGNLLKNL
jgi:hypothetical protein